MDEEGERFLRNPDLCGGSVIVGPDSRVVAGPLGAEEGILHAELDLEVGIKMKLRHDFAGHYNRPDVFQLRMNAEVPQIFGVVAPQPALHDGDEPEQLPVPPSPRALPE